MGIGASFRGAKTRRRKKPSIDFYFSVLRQVEQHGKSSVLPLPWDPPDNFAIKGSMIRLRKHLELKEVCIWFVDVDGCSIWSDKAI